MKINLLKILTSQLPYFSIWVKAYSGINGNEVAVRVAKLGHRNNKSELHHLEHEEMQIMLKRQHMTAWCNYWKTEVAKSQKGIHLLEIQDSVKFNNWVFMNNRREEVVLSRLRTGHAATKVYLHRFGWSHESKCDNCDAEDTIKHLLLDCPKYIHDRNKLIGDLAKYNLQNFNLKTLLGGEGRV